MEEKNIDKVANTETEKPLTRKEKLHDAWSKKSFIRPPEISSYVILTIMGLAFMGMTGFFIGRVIMQSMEINALKKGSIFTLLFCGIFFLLGLFLIGTIICDLIRYIIFKHNFKE